MEGGVDREKDDADGVSVKATAPLEYVFCAYEERRMGDAAI